MFSFFGGGGRTHELPCIFPRTVIRLENGFTYENMHGNPKTQLIEIIIETRKTKSVTVVRRK
jgi:hypothetical protein